MAHARAPWRIHTTHEGGLSHVNEIKLFIRMSPSQNMCIYTHIITTQTHIHMYREREIYDGMQDLDSDRSQIVLNIRQTPGKSWFMNGHKSGEYDNNFFEYSSLSLNRFSPNSNTNACAIEALQTCLWCCLQLVPHVLSAHSVPYVLCADSVYIVCLIGCLHMCCLHTAPYVPSAYVLSAYVLSAYVLSAYVLSAYVLSAHSTVCAVCR